MSGPLDEDRSQAQVRDFRPGDEAAFRRLNEEWLTAYFHVEPKDLELFNDPAGQFIAPGGAILMLDVAGQTVGTCALINMGDGNYEVAKMAITPSQRGHGYGELLLRAVIDRARKLGARRLFIETSSKLPPAIALYRKLGFVELSPELVPPSEYARADVFMDLWL